MTHLTAEKLRDVMHYNPDTGIFRWTKSRTNAVKDGTELKPNNPYGYIEVRVLGWRGFAHRLAFLFMDGKLPDNYVDHINGDKTDNRWSNLRDVPHVENMKNRCLSKSSSSGAIGVSYCKSTGRWKAYINVGDKQKHLGRYDGFEEAVAARKNAEVVYGFHENHGRAAIA